MPTPGALRPIHRVPSGFPGPGGTGCSPCAHGDAGGYHHGFRHLTTIWKRPSGVGYTVCPVATPKRLTSFIPSYSVNTFDALRITITGPIVFGVVSGSVSLALRTIGGRVPWTTSSMTWAT